MTAPKITIEKDPSTWRIHAHGTELGISPTVLRLTEGTYSPVLYIPQADLDMAHFTLTQKSTHCPYKGNASYFSISCGSKTLENVGWSYETPLDSVSEIKNHIAFYTDQITVEKQP